MPSTATTLWYRELQDDDNPNAMLKIQTRAPPGFNMKESLKEKRTAINYPLIRALLSNQVLILALATLATAATIFTQEGFDGFNNLQELFHWSGGNGGADMVLTPERFLTGAAAAIPIILFGNLVEASDKREFANVNFSTITMVMTLFGRRKPPPDEFLPDRLKGTTIFTSKTTDVLLQSLVLAGVTGVCEETVFRMEIPAVISHYAGGFPFLPLLGQAALFGLGHASPGSSLMENGIVMGLQFINGLWFGSLFLLTGGDLVPCIVAHAVYDFVVFFKTWLDANAQIEYAETKWGEPLPANIQKQVKQIQSRVDPRVFNLIKRLFYTFDFDKNESLSKSEVRKGLSYLALEKAGVPPPQETVDALFDAYTSEADKSRLSFPDFFRSPSNLGGIRAIA
jgi:hypothetical protein